MGTNSDQICRNSTTYEPIDARPDDTQPRSIPEVAIQLLNLPNTQDIRLAVKTCMKLLGLENDAKILLKLYSESKEELRKSDIEKTERQIQQTYWDATNRFLASLRFQEMMIREENIKRAERDTCQWIYDSQKYKSWSAAQKPLLWIKGKFQLAKACPVLTFERQAWLREIDHDEKLVR